jgi:hypothetical protein
VREFPGVYEAKSLGVKEGRLMLLIPQAFGDDVVPAAGRIGEAPPGVHGYVSFISGEVEYPVWIGAQA